MPEGPEVERVRRSLGPWVIGAQVVGVRVWRRDVVVADGDPAGGVGRQRKKASGGDAADGGPGGASGGRRLDETARQRPVPRAALLVGDRVERIDRRGKQLALIGASGRVVLVHLGMTGKLVAGPVGSVAAMPHTHVGWTLERAGARVSLRFVDPRRFGGVWVVPSVAVLEERWAALGADATVVTARQLAVAIEGSTRAIKSALLDQRVVAGVGNIYADEALFGARIGPSREAASLSPRETGRLAGAIRRVIAAAVEAGGSTIRDYADADGVPGGAQRRHKVYGRGGQACVRCGRALSAAVIGQRTTVWCGGCQGEG